MNLLARREHSEKELFRKLQRKKFAELEIQLVLKGLSQDNLLSNNRFTENYIRYRSQKGYGPLRIKGELIEKGIQEDSIDHLLNIADNAWFIQAREVWRKRFKCQFPQDFKKRAQQMRFLQYRGFTHEQIESIFQSSDDE